MIMIHTCGGCSKKVYRIWGKASNLPSGKRSGETSGKDDGGVDSPNIKKWNMLTATDNYYLRFYIFYKSLS